MDIDADMVGSSVVLGLAHQLPPASGVRHEIGPRFRWTNGEPDYDVVVPAGKVSGEVDVDRFVLDLAYRIWAGQDSATRPWAQLSAGVGYSDNDIPIVVGDDDLYARFGLAFGVTRFLSDGWATEVGIEGVYSPEDVAGTGLQHGGVSLTLGLSYSFGGGGD